MHALKTFLALMTPCGIPLAVWATGSPEESPGHDRLVPAVEARLEVPPLAPGHPRIFLGPDELETMRTRVESGEQPWGRAADELLRRCRLYFESRFSPDPYTGIDSLAFFHNATDQGMVAADLALAYRLTGNTDYGEKAREILLAWATAEPAPASRLLSESTTRFPSMSMDVSRGMMGLVKAYDLVADTGMLDAEDRAIVLEWFGELVPVIEAGIWRWDQPSRLVNGQWENHPDGSPYFGGQYYQNHLVAHTVGLLVLGIILEDKELMQFALDSDENPRDFRNLISGMILMPGDEVWHGEPDDWPPPQAGEIMDRYRHVTKHGLAYAHLSMTLLLLGAEAAWHNGIDFYAYEAPGGESMELPFAFYADFFRTWDTDIKGGFYSGEILVPANHGGLINSFEVAAARYPDNPELLALLAETDRRAIPRHRHVLFHNATLTHGIELPYP